MIRNHFKPEKTDQLYISSSSSEKTAGKTSKKHKKKENEPIDALDRAAMGQERRSVNHTIANKFKNIIKKGPEEKKEVAKEPKKLSAKERLQKSVKRSQPVSVFLKLLNDFQSAKIDEAMQEEEME